MTTFDQFIAMQASPNTRRAYRQDIVRWVSFLDGRVPTVDLVVQFKQGLEAALAPASAARCFAAIRSYYRWLGGDNPFDRVKGPKAITNTTPKTPADADVDRLIDAVDTSTITGLRDKAAILLLTNGLRAQEVADLRADAMRFEPQYGVHILRLVGKGKKERLVPMNDETVEAVLAYRRADGRVQPGTLLFDYDGSKLTYRQVEEAVYRAARRAGLEGMHPHALRHHYATRVMRGGGHILALQQLLGHARADTTQRYVGLDLADLVDAARKDPRASRGQRPTLVAVAS